MLIERVTRSHLFDSSSVVFMKVEAVRERLRSCKLSHSDESVLGGVQQSASGLEGSRLCNDGCKQPVPSQSSQGSGPVSIFAGGVSQRSRNVWLGVCLFGPRNALLGGVTLAWAHGLPATCSLVLSVRVHHYEHVKSYIALEHVLL